MSMRKKLYNRYIQPQGAKRSNGGGATGASMRDQLTSRYLSGNAGRQEEYVPDYSGFDFDRSNDELNHLKTYRDDAYKAADTYASRVFPSQDPVEIQRAGVLLRDMQSRYGTLDRLDQEIEEKEKDLALANDWAIMNRDYSRMPDYGTRSSRGRSAFDADREKARTSRESSGWLGRAFSAGDSTTPLSPMPQIIEDYRNDTTYMEPNDRWDDAQRDRFFYLYAEDPKTAGEYARRLNNQINSEEKETAMAKIAADSAKNPGSMVLNTIGAILADTAGAGNASMLDRLAELSARGTINARSDITPYDYSQAVQTGVAQSLNSHGTLPDWVPFIHGKGAGDLYLIGNEIIKSWVGAHTSGQFSPTVNYFGPSFTAGVDEALERGGTEEQAVLLGTAQGLAEVITEAMGVESLLGLDVMDGNALLNVLKQGTSEAGEEGLSSVANIISDALIMGDKSQYKLKAAQYMDSGMTREQAAKAAQKEYVDDVVYDMIGGFVSGSVSAGAETALQKGVDYAVKKQEIRDVGKTINRRLGGPNSLLSLADSFAEEDKDGKLGKRAAAYKKAVEGKNPRGHRANVAAGQLQQALKNSISGLRQGELQQALIDRGFEEEAAENMAKVMESYAMDKDLSKKDADLLKQGMKNQKVMDAVRATVLNPHTVSNQKAKSLDNIVMGAYLDEDGKALDEVQSDEEAYAPSGKYNIAEGQDAEGRTLTIASAGNGHMTLTTEDGSTVDVKDARYASRDDAIVYEAIARVAPDVKTANQMLQDYRDGKTSAEDYAFGIQQAYDFGATGISTDEMLTSDLTKPLSPAQRATAYKAGQEHGVRALQSQKDAVALKSKPKGYTPGSVDTKYIRTPESKWNAKQREGVNAVRMAAAATGAEVRMFESFMQDGKRVYIDPDTGKLAVDKNGEIAGAPHGYYKDGRVYIDINAGFNNEGAVLFTAGHEFTHFLKEWNPQKFREIADILINYYGERGMSVNQAVQDQISKAKAAGRSLTYDAAFEEFVADSMQTVLRDGKVTEFMADVRQKDQGLWQKIKSWFKDLKQKLQRIVDAYKDATPYTDEAQIASQAKDLLAKIEPIFAEGLVEAGDNLNRVGVAKNATTEESSTVGTTVTNNMADAALTDPSFIERMRADGVDVPDTKAGRRAAAREYLSRPAAKNIKDQDTNPAPQVAEAQTKKYSLNMATASYAYKYTADEKNKEKVKTLYNTLVELGSMQDHMFKPESKNSDGRHQRKTDKPLNVQSVHEINDWLKSHPEDHQRLWEIQLASNAAGITCDFVTKPGEDNIVEGKHVDGGVKGLPIEYVAAPIDEKTGLPKSGKRFKFTGFHRGLPQMYLDSISYNAREQLREELVKAVEDAYDRIHNMTGLIPSFDQQFPFPEEVKEVARQGSRSNINDLTMARVQPPLRGADKTVMALNLNSACPMFTIGNHGCYLDACYLTQMANGASGTNLFRSAWYTGEILQMNDAAIKKMNDLGGLRVNGVGDTIMDNMNALVEAIKHAGMRGLKMKIITKQRSSLEVVKRAHDQGIDVSHVTVQPSMDHLWIPAELDDVYGAGIRGNTQIADVVHKAVRDSAAASQEGPAGEAAREAFEAEAEAIDASYDVMFGRATKVMDGVIYRKYGFTADQVREMQEDYPYVNITPRYVCCTAEEICEVALNRNGDIVNGGKVIQTLMHGKVPKGCKSDYAGEIINFGANRHHVEKNEFGEWEFWGDRFNTKTKEMVRQRPKNESPYDKVMKYCKEHYTPEEQDRIWTTLKKQMCCQSNDFKDACAGCQSLCARGCAAFDSSDFNYLEYTEKQKSESMNAFLENYGVDVNELTKPAKLSARETDGAGHILTEEQLEHFRDSAVRDENGKLMPMYHGTANSGEFTVFDDSKLDNSPRKSQIGQGFYFTNIKKAARDYTKNQNPYTGRLTKGSNPHLFEAYLNIKNPFNVQKDVISFNQAKAIFMDGNYEWFFNEGLPFELNGKEINGVARTKAEIAALPKSEKVDLYVAYHMRGGNKELLQNMVRAFDSKSQGKLMESMMKNLGHDGLMEEYADGAFQYVALSPDQIKYISNKAPTSDPDIRYSTRDSEGNELSSQQQEFFRDSEVRDADGNLLVMFHGTTHYGEITKFKKGKTGYLGPGAYFTDRKETAERYANEMGIGNGSLYEVYLNVTSPLIVHDVNPAKEILEATYGVRGSNMFKKRSDSQGKFSSLITSADIKKLQGKGYDGILWDYGKTVEVNAFDQNQIKRTDNLKPTSDPDIRYSARDESYMAAVNSGNMEEAQKLVDQAATAAGYQYKAFHGSPDFGFTVFNPAKSDDRYSLFFTDSDVMASTYTYKGVAKPQQIRDKGNEGGSNIYGAFLHIDNPLVVDAKGGNWDNVSFQTKQSRKYDEIQARIEDLSEKQEKYDRQYEKDYINSGKYEYPWDMPSRNDVFPGYDAISEELSRLYEEQDNIPPKFIYSDGMTTRELSSYARSEGHDGLIIKNVHDHGGKSNENVNPEGTVYVVFNSGQVKSADPVTYDDSGNVIPLSERFKETEKDIRYSTRDSDGVHLYPGQIKFFKKSKARDEEGNLQVVHHGTVREFYTFDRDFGNVEGNFGKGFYFTNSAADVADNYANTHGPDFNAKITREAELLYDSGDSEYMDMDLDEIVEYLRNKYATAKEPVTMDCYLNITNPCYIGRHGKKKETILFSEFEKESGLSTEDYENPDDFYEDLDLYITGRIDKILDHVEENISFFDYNSWDNLSELLINSAKDGGDTVEHLRSDMEDLGIYDEDYNVADGEILRLIIEALGYDGIIDSSVPYKFRGMGLNPGTVHYIVMNSNQAKLTSNTNPTDKMDVRYSSRVTDQDTIDFLEKQSREGKVYHTFRSMQLIDGKLYPPMGARVQGKLEDESILGQWEASVEHPELATPDGKFKLDKGKGEGSLYAAYNPYMHSSNLVLNDQFTGAWHRGNLVTVEAEVPMSEEGGTYHAEKAKDSTGWHDWHSGTVAGGIRQAKGIDRKVYLSRWLKPVRIVPDSEVAQKYKEALEGTDVEIPDNVVPPNLLKELRKAGVPIKVTGMIKENKIKYSQRDPRQERTIAALQKQNAKLTDDVKDLNELLKLMGKKTGGNTFSPKEVYASAKKLMKDHNVEGDYHELAEKLVPFYNGLQESKYTTWGDIVDGAEPALQWLQTHQSGKKPSKAVAAKIMENQSWTEDLYDSFWKQRTLLSAPDQVAAQKAAGDAAVSKVRQEKNQRIDALIKAHNEELSSIKQAHKAELQDLQKQWDAEAEAFEALRKAEVEDVTKRYQERISKNVEGRKTTEVRHKLQRVVHELYKLLNNGTKEAHVPTGLRKPVAMLLDMLDMDTVNAEEKISKIEAEITQLRKEKAEYQAQLPGATDKKADQLRKHIEVRNRAISEAYERIENLKTRDQKMQARLQDLHEAYLDIANSSDPFIQNAYDPVLEALIREVQTEVGTTPIGAMNLEQIQKVYQLYKAVLQTVRNANKAHSERLRESIETMGKNTINELKTLIGRKHGSYTIFDFLKHYGWQELRPVQFFKILGSPTLNALWQEVRAGEDAFAVDIAEAKAFRLNIARKYGVKNWNTEKLYRFKDDTNTSFELNLQQIMSIYAYSRRGKQAMDHFRKGGITIGPDTVQYKSVGPFKLKWQPSSSTTYRLSDATVQEIIGKLTKDQKNYVEDMQEYLSAVMGAKGNEVSRKLYDMNLFTEKFYFPLRSAADWMARAASSEAQKASGFQQIKNKGMTKGTTPEAGNPVVLTGFDDTWANHVDEMSVYHAMVLPMEDFGKVYAYHTGYEDEAPGAVAASLNDSYGKEPGRYIEELVRQINGGVRMDPNAGIMSRGISKFKKAAVVASMSVVAQQYSSIFRAMSVIDPRYFANPIPVKGHAALWEELKKYAPVAVIKEMGGFDTGVGAGTRDYLLAEDYSGFAEKTRAFFTDSQYRDDALGRAPAYMDEVGWISIWQAAKKQAAAQNPKLSGEELKKAAGEIFTKAVTETQVYDSVMSRSGLMRSKDTGLQMLTAFMAEPTVVVNMMADAVVAARRGNKKAVGRTAGAIVLSTLVNAAMAALVYAARDDDDDQTYLEKYTEASLSKAMEGLNPLTYLPIARDIMSLVQGYDIERSDMAVASDLIKAGQSLLSSKKTPWQKIRDLSGSVASLFGIPLKNVLRDAQAIYNLFAINPGKTTAAGLADSARQALLPSYLGFRETPKDERLYRAIMSGDQEQIRRMEAQYKSEDAMHSALRRQLRENDDRILQAAKLRFEGDTAGYKRLFNEIKAEGNFDFDDIMSAINTEYNGLKPEAEPKDPDPKKEAFREEHGMTWSSRAELYIGGGISRKQLIEDIMDISGKTREEAEREVLGIEMKRDNGFSYSDIDDQFMAGDITATQARDMYVKYGGMDRTAAYEKVTTLSFVKKYPEAEGITYAAVEDYMTHCEPSGVPVRTFLDIRKLYNSISGDSKKPTTVEQINKLPISSSQKDALYLCFWAESTLKKAPWH